MQNKLIKTDLALHEKEIQWLTTEVEYIQEQVSDARTKNKEQAEQITQLEKLKTEEGKKFDEKEQLIDQLVGKLQVQKMEVAQELAISVNGIHRDQLAKNKLEEKNILSKHQVNYQSEVKICKDLASKLKLAIKH